MLFTSSGIGCIISGSPRNIDGSNTNRATRYTSSKATTKIIKITTICNDKGEKLNY